MASEDYYKDYNYIILCGTTFMIRLILWLYKPSLIHFHNLESGQDILEIHFFYTANKVILFRNKFKPRK